MDFTRRFFVALGKTTHAGVMRGMYREVSLLKAISVPL
jgi:hypothetical protein